MSIDAMVIIGLVLLAAFFIYAAMATTQCGKCGKYLAKVTDKKSNIKTWTTTETVQSREPRNDGSSPPALDYVMTTYELTFSKFLHECRCKYCDHRWEEEVEKQTGKRKLTETRW